jgi:CheY-like chemotaxis protein
MAFILVFLSILAFFGTYWAHITLMIVVLGLFISHRIKMNAMKHALSVSQSRVTEKEALLQYAREKEKKAREEYQSEYRSQVQLLTRLSRGIRNPLNGIIGTTTLLETTTLNKEQREYIKTIGHCGNDLISVVDELMKTAGMNPTHHEVETEKNIDTTEKEALVLSVDFAKKYPLSILVAEDDLMNQQMQTMILSRLGYTADIASNGNEVLDMVGEKKYDLILMDIEMPGMNGLEATRMIRLCLNSQPFIVAMTASAMESDKEICIEAGMNEYLSKPVNVDELMQMMKKSFKTSYI